MYLQTNDISSMRRELLRSFYQFLDSKGLTDTNKDYSNEWKNRYKHW